MCHSLLKLVIGRVVETLEPKEDFLVLMELNLSSDLIRPPGLWWVHGGNG